MKFPDHVYCKSDMYVKVGFVYAARATPISPKKLTQLDAHPGIAYAKHSCDKPATI